MPSEVSEEYSRIWPETKIAPKMYVTTYHSRMPQSARERIGPRPRSEKRGTSPRCALPCSAAWTPSWHHTEEITRISVLTVAYGTLRWLVSLVHSSGSTERI